jgi:hypothetical protein
MNASLSLGKLPISGNPLLTREDLQTAVQQLCEPLIGHYSAGKARLNLGVTGTSYSGAKAGMEGFSRVLWGLVPLAAGGGDSVLWETCLEGIRNGTNPEHAEYWGEVGNYDQLLVEMAALGFALALAPEKIWEPLNEADKHNFYTWLNQINSRELYDCNWLFFQVLVSLGFRNVGMPYNQARMEANLDRIDQFYLDNGWYADGIAAHCDYYGPFAIHYYSLLYAKLMEQEDPRRSSLYKERAAMFAKQFIYWFSGEGDALPYGRSLAYRFSQAAFWGALVYAEAEPFAPGVVKGIVLRHLRWWFQQPIFHADGTLTIGYAYPNLIMSENYNSPGSPYWAFKVFLPLAFAPEHPFWTSAELPLPELEARFVQEQPRMVICRQEDRHHVLTFNAGCKTTNQHTHTSAKYEKFVYSNKFGFSVPRAEWGLAQSACDSMLALSEGDNLYRVKRQIEEYAIDGNVIYMRWKPWHDVDVQTWLITGAPWHIRVHRIRSGRPLDAADGGFALGFDDEPWQASQEGSKEDSKTVAASKYGASGALALHGWAKADAIHVQANTNVLHPRTVIPTLTASLPQGTTLLASAFYGQPESSAGDSLTDWQAQPTVSLTGNDLVIRSGSIDGSEICRIDLTGQLA